MIFGEADEDGFYQGELNGIRGLVPSNFITPASPADDEVMDGTSVVSPCRSGDSLENNTAETTTNESDWPHKVGHSDIPIGPSVVSMLESASYPASSCGDSDGDDENQSSGKLQCCCCC